jgi:hypothetical protein
MPHLELQTQPIISVGLFLSPANRKIANQKKVASSQALRFIVPPEEDTLPKAGVIELHAEVRSFTKVG